MKEAQQPWNYLELDEFRRNRLPKVRVRFAIPPNEVVAWRVPADGELTVRNARIWLTRAGSDYDFWLLPNAPALCLRCGERIWLSTDAATMAEVSVSMANSGAFSRLIHIIARFFL